MALGEGQFPPQRRKGLSLSRGPEDRLCLPSWLSLSACSQTTPEKRVSLGGGGHLAV